jgi:geranylgeranyl reductase family protein
VEHCDVVIVGGGPSGSTCARQLIHAGLDVVVVDKAQFPRDKVCAGWITPQVVDALELDTGDYRRGRTFQPITSFSVGLIDGTRTVDTEYRRPVSFGIRRCEFDDYLLKRSGARMRLGATVSKISRDGAYWILDDTIATPLLVGAGGHFCPVARAVGGTAESPVVAAQEVEYVVERRAALADAVAGDRPELYFCQDFSGYGWCFRKQDHLNVGFGQVRARALPAATNAFVAFLKRAGRIPDDAPLRWHGHAYLLAGPARRPSGDGFVLIGDAAGLAYRESGEGIRPAVESAVMAAAAIVRAEGRYTAERLAHYDRDLQRRFGASTSGGAISSAIPPALSVALARQLLGHPWFVRRFVLDRWFLHAHHPALTAAHAA